jgi:hypothetical protein
MDQGRASKASGSEVTSGAALLSAVIRRVFLRPETVSLGGQRGGMFSPRPIGFALLTLAVALTVWGMFRQVDPVQHTHTFTAYITASLVASVVGFVLSAD